jgi:uncharacterized membrane protein YecN with MAPEG domain
MEVNIKISYEVVKEKMIHAVVLTDSGSSQGK